MSKRKRAPTPERANPSDNTLSLTAYEADIVSDKPHLAVALDQRTRPGESQAGLICMDSGIWVDRFDVRLLLPSLPEYPRAQASEEHRSENEGWDELPSDAEDVWFLRSEEAEEYRYKKRRKLNDDMRNARLRQIEAQTRENPDELWGGSDEEPDEHQITLMQRTATHIISSPNPEQLEMRILANHGKDPRFSFLRGRWKSAWIRLKAEEMAKLECSKPTPVTGLSNLIAYGTDSDEEDVDGHSAPGLVSSVETRPQGLEAGEAGDVGEEVKAARRLRAKEWAKKRRAEKEAALG